MSSSTTDRPAPTDADELAIEGGRRSVPRGMTAFPWPIVTEDDHARVRAVLDGGRLVSNVDGTTAVSELEEAWARRCEVAHCVAMSNGTTALAAALAAVGVLPGDEVVVPAMIFIDSGLAPVHQMAVPVFADVDPVTFTLDPAAVKAAITSRTTAIMPVHLHGQPADMDALGDIARRHGLAVVEDAAQAHGARWRGRPVGSLGDAAAFSLQVTKNLPTCGEGGLLTTDADDVRERAMLVRQFGEVIEAGRERDYVSYELGWNHKMNAVQAGFALGQLDRFDEYEQARQSGIPPFLDRLAALPGITVPQVSEGSTHAWHILRFRFDPELAGCPGLDPGDFRAALHRVLRAEGVPVSRYQLLALPDQKVFTDRTGFGRGYPWTLLPAGIGERPDHPVARAVVDDSLTLQKRHLHPEAGRALQRYADGFEKVWRHLDVVARLAEEEGR